MDFASITTLRTGGPAPRLEVSEHEGELVDAVRQADGAGEPVLVIGAGSHLVVSDAGFEGLLITDGRTQISEVDSFVSCGGSTVRVTAGTGLDEFVRFTIGSDLAGLEALSGIPGTIGGAVVTNAGAFGQEIAQTLASVRALDRESGYIRTLSRYDLRFAYRSSVISRSRTSAAADGRLWGPTGRWVVLDATFQLRSASLSEPIRYQSLARSLGTALGTRVPSADLRSHVMELRRESGMLPNPKDHDTWSVGAYFANPILDEDVAAMLPTDVPRFAVRNQAMFISGTVHKQAPLVEGKVKIPARRLIQQVGFTPGYRLRDDARAGLSTKAVGAITNLGGATTAEILELAGVIRDRVYDRFGIELRGQAVPVGLDSL